MSNTSTGWSSLLLAVLLCLTTIVSLADDGANIVPTGYVAQREVPGKYALVISVEDYKHFPKVDNALNDGRVVHQALLDAGFTFVRYLQNPATANIIIDHLKELMQQAQVETRPAIVVVFFAGHGFQTQGVNYLVPQGARSELITQDSVPVSTILKRISVDVFSIGIVFLDACRTVHTLDDTNGATSLLPRFDPGFLAVQDDGITVISMATSAGRAAQSFGNGNPLNSPYSGALSQSVALQSVSLDDVLDRVRSLVRQDTQRRQDPVVIKRAGTSHFFIVPGDREASEEEAVWRRVMAQHARRNCLEDYVARFPSGWLS